MKLLAENSSAFRTCIDDKYTPEVSIACRYRNALQFYDDAEHDQEFKRNLLQTTIREGARVIELLTYKDVTVHVVDETSGMATGSLKAIDGCLTAALCLMEGAARIALESGGNTGSALTRYGRQAGMETFFFCPQENLDLLDSRLFKDRRAHLIGVAEPMRVKEFTKLFAQTAGIRHVPDKSWRYAASMLRGLFLLEHILERRNYDWISQTVSAAFGPIGIYRVLNGFPAEIPVVPRFLGIQQEANCPMYKAWRQKTAGEGIPEREQGRLLTRVMYDNTPQSYKTYDDLHRLLALTHGEMLTVNEEEFDVCANVAAGGPIVDLLLSRGIAISMRSGEIIEKTGIIALAGTLKAIDAGIIRPGSSVLCCVTGGVTEADGHARPEITLRSREDVLEYVGKVTGGK